MEVPVSQSDQLSLLEGAVQQLSPHTRKLILAALEGAAGPEAPCRLLQALAQDLAAGPAPEAGPGLRAEGERWAAEQRSVGDLAQETIRAAQRLAEAMPPLSEAEEKEAELLRLTFVSEVLTGYVRAREEAAAQERSTALKARMNELAALHKVISAANSSLDLDATLHLVVQTVAEVMRVEVCELYLFEPQRGALVLGASVGLNPDAAGRLRLNLGEGVTGWAAQSGHPLAVSDVRQESRFRYEPSLHEEPYHSMLSVPIVLYTVEKLVGVLNVRTRQVRTYTPEEIDFLEMVAGEMAISLENARLYQDTDQRLHQKVDELTTLQRVSAMVAGTLDLEETLALITEQSAKLGQADMAVVVEGRPIRHEPTVVASWGLPEAPLADLQQWLERGEVYRQITTAGRPRLILADPEGELANWACRVDLTALLCMPMRSKEGLLGVICLHSIRPDGFSPEQVDLLAVFAEQAALAIENARLYSELRRTLDLRSTMLQEMHHRVRNNLQAVASLLNMQMRRLRDPQVKRYLAESASRIQSIAAVHDLLCQKVLGITTVQAIARGVLEVASAHLARPGLELQCRIVEEPPLLIGSKEATLLALLVNELVSNAIDHGFAEQQEGTVIVDAYRSDGLAVLQVKDDGRGPTGEVTEHSGLGLQIVQALATRDLGGTFSLQRDGDWTVAIITFPYEPPDEVAPPADVSEATA
ncbi:MAG: GAF domain-containing protein [Chloroflexia bacterium]|nr:GAF domain-containing protein [Chloroflexia bacterium]